MAASKKRREFRAVSTRLNVTSVRLLAEKMAARIPQKAFNFRNAKVRQSFAEWVLREFKHLSFSLAYDYQKAAQRGIEEMQKLIESDEYYEVVAAREKRAEALMSMDPVKRDMQRLRKQTRKCTKCGKKHLGACDGEN